MKLTRNLGALLLLAFFSILPARAVVDIGVCTSLDQPGCTAVQLKNNTNEEIQALDKRAKVMLTGVSGNNLAVTACSTPAVTSLVNGQMFGVTPTATNSGPVALSVCGLSAVNVTTEDGTALSAGQFTSTKIYTLVLDAPNNQLRIITGIASAGGGGGGSVPAGSVMQYAGTTAPGGWALMYGQELSRAGNADLFAAIGTTYGVGDGSTTFNLPDVRGRTVIGDDNMGGTAANRVTTAGSGIDGITLGATGGAQNVTLTITQMPSHTHTVSNTWRQGTGAIDGYGSSTPSAIVIRTNNTIVPANEGGGQPHNNMPPALVLNWIIKL